MVVICSIENFDPMGVHTGDSITGAPAQTLTDKEYQAMRNAAIAVIRETGVETGGADCVPIITTVQGALAALEGMKTLKKPGLQVKSLQDHHATPPL